MKEIDVETLKSIQIEILLYVKQFCNKHDLTYYLSGGTLLGAIRHSGFIPWDDDIDILMPREDYEELRVRMSRKKHDLYELKSMYIQDDYYFPFIKISRKDTSLTEKNVKPVKLTW